MTIEKQLKMGNLNTALDLLVEQTASVAHLHSDAILLQASWKSTENDYKKGLLSRKEYDLTFNRTVDGIQHLMRIESDLFGKKQIFDTKDAGGGNVEVLTRGIKRWLLPLLATAVLLLLILLARQYLPVLSKKEVLDTGVTAVPPSNASGPTTPKHYAKKADAASASRPGKSVTGVILYDESGESNIELSTKLSELLRQSGFEVQVCKQIETADFENRFEARIALQTEEIIFFNKKAFRHHIRLNISLLKAQRTACPVIEASTVVESGTQEGKHKIMEQALPTLFAKISNQKLLDNCR